VLVIMILLLVVATVVTQAFSFEAIRALEGYWPGCGLPAHGGYRPHRALNQAAPFRPPPDGVTNLDRLRVQRRDRAGGVIHEYGRVA
jgi:hypothetical protein